MGVTVKMDSKGRLLVPAEIREELGADEFILEKVEGGLLLRPIPKIEDPLANAKKIAIRDTRPVKEIRRWMRKELERR